jgi:hypothetical protein
MAMLALTADDKYYLLAALNVAIINTEFAIRRHGADDKPDMLKPQKKCLARWQELRKRLEEVHPVQEPGSSGRR